MADEEPCYGPDELAERAGVSRRTVRYYVQRGLLPAPQGLGRGKHYGASHLAQLIRIRALQEAGEPLERIAALLSGQGEPAPAPSPVRQSEWTRVVLAPDVELHLRGRRLSDEQLRALAQYVTLTLGGDAP